MILQELIRQVRQQNWFVVGVEITVVVIGIFLGMQATEWNEERLEKIEEQEYIQRLIADTETILQVQEQQLKDENAAEKKRTLAIQLVHDKNLSEDNIEQFITGYGELFKASTPRTTIPTLDEMISSGKLTLLQSTRLRASISYFRAMSQEYALANEQTRDLMVKNFYALEGLIVRGPRRYKILTPLEEINNSSEIYTRINSLGGYHETLRYFHELLHQETRKLHRELLASE